MQVVPPCCSSLPRDRACRSSAGTAQSACFDARAENVLASYLKNPDITAKRFPACISEPLRYKPMVYRLAGNQRKKMTKDRVRHSRIDLPAYQLVVHERPKSLQGKKVKKSAYLKALRSEAVKQIPNPILSGDIEVEICWATNIRIGMRADIDNIIKPTLDALIGIAYDDDRKVRSVTATLFDLSIDNKIEGYVEDFAKLFFPNNSDAVQIAIYSDTRVAELGGYESLSKRKSEEFDKRFQNVLDSQIKSGILHKG
jgi:Holliday junction resolvase RusA-like endonuclease